MAQDRVEAVERALTVLEAFDSPQEHFTLADLAQATGFYKSTLLRLLGSLERHDYVQRGADGRWRLGSSPSRLARRHAPSRQLATCIQPLLDRLTAETGETAALLEVQPGIAECRLVALPAADLRHDLRPGQRWEIATPEDPRPSLPGGTMECHLLEGDPHAPSLWLTLSGPASRLSPQRARHALDSAVARLHKSKEATP
ncbi:helix-turn-helix domain-containing protein [Halomonas caseinilytica]|uniref:IclR helix-turn-helix domain-containing protein n=1 Tax=Halomonas caseinilytica TaxID=438744 RepID=A0A1M6U4L1_9GAMM|nr:helix-turn-helix domain-containing protein [Halomonas caseinilytica]SEM93523.1 transcriptional regulator, IclR family [Halomonas caseinilytica]SHK64094.1 IclR helix-turn-helix domain-containing protein [Halomonas caseinilytica]